MLASALSFAGMDILIKVMGTSFSTWQIAFFRLFGGSLALLAFLAPRGNPFHGEPVALLLLRGVVGCGAFLGLAAAIRLLPLSTAMVLFYSYPAFAAALGALLFRERISGGGVVCLATAVAGIAVLLDFRGVGSLLGQGAALAASVLAGLVAVLIRRLRTRNGSAVIYLYFCVVGTALTLPAFAAAPRLPATPTQWALALALVVTSSAGQLLMNQGFVHCSSWEGGLIMSSEVAFAALVGVVYFGDPVTWRLAAGSFLILGSVVAVQVASRRGSGRPTGPLAGESNPDAAISTVPG
jgi:drug/metabolite transporter (DMT)-like permease